MKREDADALIERLEQAAVTADNLSVTRHTALFNASIDALEAARLAMRHALTGESEKEGDAVEP